MEVYWSRVVDIDGDGYVDLVIDDPFGWKNSYRFYDYIFFNNGDGTFAQNLSTLATGLVVENNAPVMPIDFNRDGLMDFIVGRPCGLEDYCKGSRNVYDLKSMYLLEGTRPLPALVPTSPVIESVFVRDGKIDLEVVSKARGSEVIQYDATCRSDSLTVVASSETSRIEVDGLAIDAAYKCVVSAINGAGRSVLSTETESIYLEAGSLPTELPIWMLYEASKSTP
jgi:hypothetical protein